MKTNQPALPADIHRLLVEPETVITLATLSKQCAPQIDFLPELRVTDDHHLEYLEFFEGSRTQKHLFQALWFNLDVTIALRGKSGAIFEIQGRPVKVHVTGELFQLRYVEVRASGRSEGLAGVWHIAPTRVSERSPAVLAREYSRQEPFHLHLDAFALA